MIYGSVCSGIEAASVAWAPLGWRASFLSEIEAFPRAVLSHHYPAVSLHGDFTTIQAEQYDAIDILVGGTPCQSFSIAGLRGGLADDRGNLALEYLLLAKRLRPRWLVWENVPGVLSSNGGRDFGSILGGLGELGYGFAYRVLDAQYVRVDGFGRAVPQRRRRVFVVGHLGDWRRAASVLFERDCMQGHPAPRREAGERPAPTLAARTKSGGGLGTDFDCDGWLVALNDLGGVSHALTAKHSATGRYDPNGETWVAHALRGGGFDASEDGTGRGTPLVPICLSTKDYGNDSIQDLAPTLRSMNFDKSHANAGGQLGVAFAIQAGALRENPATGPDGVGVQEGIAYTLEARAEVQATCAGWRVRRLTPLECERLQGFPDDYTDVIYRGKKAADGPRYKALGNSMAVNCMRWVGRRIEMVERICEQAA